MFFWDARPMNEEWKMRPYLGVLPLVLSARKRAFSAPRICTVDAGYLAKFVREPACDMSRAPTISPMSADRLGATECILLLRYSRSRCRYSSKAMTRCAKVCTLTISTSEMS